MVVGSFISLLTLFANMGKIEVKGYMFSPSTSARVYTWHGNLLYKCYSVKIFNNSPLSVIYCIPLVLLVSALIG